MSSVSLADVQAGLINSVHEQLQFLYNAKDMSLGEVGSFLYRYFTPEPLSPLFRDGGFLYGYNEDLVFTLIIMFGLFLIDNLLVKPLLLPKARYFALHAVANAIVVVTSLPDIFKALTVHPYDTLNGPCFTVVGNSATVALHLYHILAFKLTYDDWAHHLQFIPMCAFAPALKHKIGCMVALSNFFLSGLPGGLEYIFLVLVMHGKMEKSTEKAYFAWLNVWVRGPGAVWAAVLGYFSWRVGILAQGSIHPVIAWTFGLFHIYNGMHFCMIAVESQARFEYKKKYGIADDVVKPQKQVENNNNNNKKASEKLQRSQSPLSPGGNPNKGVFS